MGNKLLILGVDPGSQNLGYGVVQLINTSAHKSTAKHATFQISVHTEIQYVEHGVFTVPGKLLFNERLHILGEHFAQLVERLRPHWVSVERVFIGKNVDSAFKLGHIRGVCISESLRNKAKVAEYATREIKKGVTGQGSSEKEQVALILEAALNLTRGKITSSSLDASDALAAAFHHAQQILLQSRLAVTKVELDLNP